MSDEIIARIEAPRDASALIGHRAAASALAEAWNSDRLAHAWMLAGPPGIGKATLGSLSDLSPPAANRQVRDLWSPTPNTRPCARLSPVRIPIAVWCAAATIPTHRTVCAAKFRSKMCALSDISSSTLRRWAAGARSLSIPPMR